MRCPSGLSRVDRAPPPAREPRSLRAGRPPPHRTGFVDLRPRRQTKPAPSCTREARIGVEEVHRHSRGVPRLGRHPNRKTPLPMSSSAGRAPRSGSVQRMRHPAAANAGIIKKNPSFAVQGDIRYRSGRRETRPRNARHRWECRRTPAAPGRARSRVRSRQPRYEAPRQRQDPRTDGPDARSALVPGGWRTTSRPRGPGWTVSDRFRIDR